MLIVFALSYVMNDISGALENQSGLYLEKICEFGILGTYLVLIKSFSAISAVAPLVRVPQCNAYLITLLQS